MRRDGGSKRERIGVKEVSIQSVRVRVRVRVKVSVRVRVRISVRVCVEHSEMKNGWTRFEGEN